MLLNTYDLMVFCPQESYSLGGGQVNKQHHTSHHDELLPRERSKSNGSLLLALLIVIWNLGRLQAKGRIWVWSWKKRRCSAWRASRKGSLKFFWVEGGTKDKTSIWNVRWIWGRSRSVGQESMEERSEEWGQKSVQDWVMRTWMPSAPWYYSFGSWESWDFCHEE